MGRGGFDLSLAGLGGERVEIDRTTGADHLDGLPPRRSTSVVCLLGLFERPLLRAPGGGAVRRRRAVRLPPVLWLGLCKPTGSAHAPRRVPGAKDQDEAWRQREPL